VLNCCKHFCGIKRSFEIKYSFLGGMKGQVMAVFSYGRTRPWAQLEKVQEGHVTLGWLGLALREAVRWWGICLRLGKGLGGLVLTVPIIPQCICQLLDALALSGCGGVNLASQLENITDMLFNMVSVEVLEASWACLVSFLWRCWFPPWKSPPTWHRFLLSGDHKHTHQRLPWSRHSVGSSPLANSTYPACPWSDRAL
jgi:hypothetical protein